MVCMEERSTGSTESRASENFVYGVVGILRGGEDSDVPRSLPNHIGGREDTENPQIKNSQGQKGRKVGVTPRPRVLRSIP